MRIHVRRIWRYDVNRIDTHDYRGYEREQLRNRIYHLRKLKSPPKNYDEVYKLFCEANQNRKFKPSYSSFYQYARKYWQEVDWDGKTFGEIIDKMDDIDNSVDTDDKY